MPIRFHPLLAAALVAATAAAAAPRDAARECPFEITSNKPFVQVRVGGSGPQWFILDSGCSGGSVIERSCAVRLKLQTVNGDTRHMGAGSGVDVRLATTRDVTLHVAGDTLGAPAFRVLSLAHVAPFEGRRIDGLLGEDFLRRHVVVIDYATRRLRILDPAGYAPPAGAIAVPLSLETGLAVANGSITAPGGEPIPCRLIVDTGVRTTVVLFHPFSLEHGLLGAGGRAFTATVGGGLGGESRGDVARLERLELGAFAFQRPTAVYSRDTTGVFASGAFDGIVGGGLLRRCRVTFDYPRDRLLLEPYPGPSPAFDYDMSGTFLVAEGADFGRIEVLSVADGTPAAEAGLRKGDEILSVDGRRAPALGLDGIRALFRRPARYRLEIGRGGERLRVELTTRRLV